MDVVIPWVVTELVFVKLVGAAVLPTADMLPPAIMSGPLEALELPRCNK